jgi:hypothetical protein
VQASGFEPIFCGSADDPAKMEILRRSLTGNLETIDNIIVRIMRVEGGRGGTARDYGGGRRSTHDDV